MTTTHGRRGGVIVTAKITRAGMTTTSDCDAASHCNKILRRHAADARLQSHRERTQQPASVCGKPEAMQGSADACRPA